MSIFWSFFIQLKNIYSQLSQLTGYIFRLQEALAMLNQLGDVRDLRRQMLQGAVLARRPQATDGRDLMGMEIDSMGISV